MLLLRLNKQRREALCLVVVGLQDLLQLGIICL